MGLFGSGAPASAMPYDPSQLSGNDKAMMIGAMLRDAGAAARGDDSTNNVMAMRQMLLGRQLFGAQQQFLQGMLGSSAPPRQAQYDPSQDPNAGAPTASADGSPSFNVSPDAWNATRAQALQAAQAQMPMVAQRTGGITPSDPRYPAMMAAGKLLGVDTDVINKGYELQKPVTTNGVTYSPWNAPDYIPKEVDGMTPQFDHGHFLGVSETPGYNANAVKQAAERAAAEAQGKATVENANTLETHQIGDRTVMAPKAWWLSQAGGGEAGAASPQAPTRAPPAAGRAPAGMVVNGRLDPTAFFKSFTISPQAEGTAYNPRDLNGAPVRFGINQAANPDIDVKNLTPDQAAGVFRDRYFAKSGAANLPPDLAVLHADTYWMNPSVATRILKESGGDPTAYMNLRAQWMGNILQSNPRAQAYAKAWSTRNGALWNLSQSLAGQGATAPAPSASSGAPSGGITAYSKEDQQKVANAEATAKLADDLAESGHRFLDLNKSTFTDPSLKAFHVPLPFMHGEGPDINVAGGLYTQRNASIPSMEREAVTQATTLRSLGQRLTQMEFQKNLGASMSHENTLTQNQQIGAGYDRTAGYQRAYANFLRNYLNQNGSLNGADTAWSQLQAQQRQPRSAGSGAGRLPQKAQAVNVPGVGIVQVRPH